VIAMTEKEKLENIKAKLDCQEKEQKLYWQIAKKYRDDPNYRELTEKELKSIIKGDCLDILKDYI
jgi:hypothetical protein